MRRSPVYDSRSTFSVSMTVAASAVDSLRPTSPRRRHRQVLIIGGIHADEFELAAITGPRGPSVRCARVLTTRCVALSLLVAPNGSVAA
jgi:hypothetical protein